VIFPVVFPTTRTLAIPAFSASTLSTTLMVCNFPPDRFEGESAPATSEKLASPAVLRGDSVDFDPLEGRGRSERLTRSVEPATGEDLDPTSRPATFTGGDLVRPGLSQFVFR